MTWVDSTRGLRRSVIEMPRKLNTASRAATISELMGERRMKNPNSRSTIWEVASIVAAFRATSTTRKTSLPGAISPMRIVSPARGIDPLHRGSVVGGELGLEAVDLDQSTDVVAEVISCTVDVVDAPPRSRLVGDPLDVDQVQGGDVVGNDRSGAGPGPEHEAGLEVRRIAHAGDERRLVHQDAIGRQSGEGRNDFGVVGVHTEGVADPPEAEHLLADLVALLGVADLVPRQDRIELFGREGSVATHLRLD